MNSKKRLAIRYSAAFLVTAAVTVLFAIWQGAFEADGNPELLLALCNAFFAGGALALLAVLVTLLIKAGIFDTLLLSFGQIASTFKKDPEYRGDRSLYDYREKKKNKRRCFWELIAAGALFILVAVILNIALTRINEVRTVF